MEGTCSVLGSEVTDAKHLQAKPNHLPTEEGCIRVIVASPIAWR